jgi:hypothetical protein
MVLRQIYKNHLKPVIYYFINLGMLLKFQIPVCQNQNQVIVNKLLNSILGIYLFILTAQSDNISQVFQK